MSTSYHYPLGQHHADIICSKTGIKLKDITLEAVLEGQVDSGDLAIHSDTLLMQAALAEEAGYSQVARNLRYAAELVPVPDEDILRIYNALRPHRSTYAELQALADELEQHYAAQGVAGMIREAARVYQARNLLRRDSISVP